MADTADGAGTADTKPMGRHRWGKRILLALAGIVVLLLLLALLAPTLLSTGWGNGLVVSQINCRIAGKVKIEVLSLAWFSGQQINGLTLVGPDGKTVLQAATIKMPDATLWAILRGSKDFGAVTVIQPSGTIEQLADGTTNLAAALKMTPSTAAAPSAGAPEPAAKSTIPLDMKLKLLVTGGSLAYAAPGMAQMQIKDLGVAADLLDLQHITLDTKATVSQGSGAGTLAVKGTIEHLLAADGTIDQKGVKIVGGADVIGLPVAALDHLLQQNGRLVNLLGQVLDAQITTTSGTSGGTFKLVAHSANMRADAAADLADAVWTVKPDSTIHLTVTPEGWSGLSQNAAGSATLTKNFDVDLTLKRLEAGTDYANAKVDAAMTVTPIVLNAPDLGGTVQVRDTSVTISSDGLAKLVKARVHAVAEQDGQPGTVDIAATLTDLLAANGALNKNAMAMDVEGGITDLPLPVIDKVLQLNGLLGAAIGPKLNATLTIAMKPTGAGISSGTFALKATAQNVSADISNISMTTTHDGIAVAAGGKGTLVLQPALADYFLRQPAASQGMKLLEPVTIGLAIGPVNVPIKNGKLDAAGASLNGSMTVDKVVADGVAGPGTMTATGANIAIKSQRMADRVDLSGSLARIILPPVAGRVNPDIGNVRFVAQGSNPSGPATAGIDADVAQGTQKGAIHADVTINEMKNPLDGLKADVNVQSLPVAIVDALANQSGKLVALLGAQLSKVNVHADTDAARMIHFTAAVDSPQLTAALAGNLRPAVTDKSGRQISLDKSTAQLTVTPEGYAAWTTPAAGNPATPAPAQRLALDAPLILKLALNQADVAWTTDGQIDPQQVKLALQVTGAGGEFKTAQGRVLRVDGLTASADTQNLTRQVKVLAQASLVDPAGTATPAKVVTLLNISGLALPGGKVNLDNATVQMGIELDAFPVALLDQLLQRDGEFAGLLGNTMTLTTNGNIAPTGKSPLFLVLESDNAKANVSALVDGGMHGTLRLAGDATVTMAVTQELSDAFLKKITGWVNPSSGDKPISLLIHHDTFSMPLGDLNLKSVVADADMDMSVLNMKANDPIVGAAFLAIEDLRAAAQSDGKFNAMSLLQSGAGLLIKNKNAAPQTVSFTPMTMHLENGTATYTNMTMTMQDLQFGFQGNVNMNNKANQLTMTIFGQSIAAAFPRWAGSVKPGMDITVPIGGTYDAPTLNYKTLGTSVLKFAAGMGVGGNSKAGQLLQGLGGLLGKGSKPAKNPPATQR
jgi:hypothetical protein